MLGAGKPERVGPRVRALATGALSYATYANVISVTVTKTPAAGSQFFRRHKP